MLHQIDFRRDANIIVADIGNSAVATSAAVQPEKTDLQMPVSTWIMMMAAYSVFFAGLILATARDGGTIFVIIISILYTLMYFGVASILFSPNRPEQKTLFARGLEPLATYTGPMDFRAIIFG